MNIEKNIYDTLKSAEYHINEMEDGDIIYVAEEQSIYIKDGDGFRHPNGDINVQMTQYEINKQVYAQLPPKTPEELGELAQIIIDFYKNISFDHRTMLLCRDINYYTIIEGFDCAAFVDFDSPEEAIIVCANDIGEILDINAVDGAVEIWVKTPEGEAMAMYLFECENCFVSFSRGNN